MSDLDLDKLKNERWRLDNLYWLQTKKGARVKFHMWPEQQELYDNMHYLNVVLKARQRGMTTFIQIFMLDRCLFNPDTSAGVIAHTTLDAATFFNNKIKFAYDHLPAELRSAVSADKSNLRELAFNNGSRIAVGTSLRSTTLQYLHVSEYGKLWATHPDKGAEVRAGALNTISPGNFVFIESTAEGRHGHFFDLCQESMHLRDSGAPLTKMDYKFHFFPWYRAPEYRLAEHVSVPREMVDYFDELEAAEGVSLDREQRAWYYKKSIEQGGSMKSEFPATPGEAFEKTLIGAIFAQQLRKARDEKRICAVPLERGTPVNTFWDLGYNDINAIWFHQRVGPWDHFIDYYENRLEDITHYMEVMDGLAKERGYQWGTVFLPHDGSSKHIAAVEGTAADILRRGGYKVRVVDRPVRKVPSIESARKRFGSCRFDKERVDRGLRCLENYQWRWDDKGDTYSKQPVHNFASNGADAFQTFSFGYRGDGTFAKQREDSIASREGLAYTRKRRGVGGGLERNFDHVL